MIDYVLIISVCMMCNQYIKALTEPVHCTAAYSKCIRSVSSALEMGWCGHRFSFCFCRFWPCSPSTTFRSWAGLSWASPEQASGTFFSFEKLIWSCRTLVLMMYSFWKGLRVTSSIYVQRRSGWLCRSNSSESLMMWSGRADVTRIVCSLLKNLRVKQHKCILVYN